MVALCGSSCPRAGAVAVVKHAAVSRSHAELTHSAVAAVAASAPASLLYSASSSVSSSSGARKDALASQPARFGHVQPSHAGGYGRGIKIV